MKKLLFIGHSFHKKTKSADFMKEFLSKKYALSSFYFDPYADDWSIFDELKGKEYDILVLWQIMPPMKILKERLPFKHGVFFPMYDGAPHYLDKRWLEYKDFNIINFSKTLHNGLSKNGFSSFYIQYFIEPKDYVESKNSDVFFWQRVDGININTLNNLFAKENVNIHIHKAIDPEHTFVEPTPEQEQKYNITYSTWFDTKEQMQECIQSKSIYIAPRLAEGIGMSFLEAMAMGKVVVAYNYPTMNEYISDGKTGLLYDIYNPNTLDLSNVDNIRKNTYEYAKKGYEAWLADKHKILDWVESEVIIDKSLMVKYKRRLLLRKILKIFFKIKEKDKVRIVKILGISILKIKRTY